MPSETIPEMPLTPEEKLRSKVHLIFGEHRHDFAKREGEAGEGSEGLHEIEHLATELMESEGKLSLLVHPFCPYGEKMPSPYDWAVDELPELKERLERCDEAFDTMLADPNRPPLIILEDRKHLDACIKRCLERGIDMPRDVYLIPTMENWGVPFIGPPRDSEDVTDNTHPLVIESYGNHVHKNKGRSAKGKSVVSPVMEHVSDRYKKGSWGFIAGMLKAIGTKEINIGGKYLDIAPNAQGEQILQRCLGEVYDFMKLTTASIDGLEVHLTDATFPLGRKDLAGAITLLDEQQEIEKGFDVNRSPMKSAYLLLGAHFPAQLYRLYSAEDQKLMKARAWDYKNPELLVNKIKEIVEPCDPSTLTPREKVWRQELLWFWYHHAISSALWKHKDRERAQLFSAKALEYKSGDNPNAFTKLLELLAHDEIDEARQFAAEITQEPERLEAPGLIDDYLALGKF